jgi:zinc protease
MNRVIGGNFNARINMNLREDKGWSYGASTTLVGAKGPRPFLVIAPVQTDRTADSLLELIAELGDIRRERPVRAEEMARVIAGATRELPGRFETSSAVLGSIASSARYGRDLDYASTLTDRYQALELGDLQDAAEDIINPDALVWIIVGDLAQIRDQVEALDIADLEIWNENGEAVE